MPTQMRIRRSDGIPLHLHPTNRNPEGRWHSPWERHHDMPNAHEVHQAGTPTFLVGSGRNQYAYNDVAQAIRFGVLSQRDYDRYLQGLEGVVLQTAMERRGVAAQRRIDPYGMTPARNVAAAPLADDWMQPVTDRTFGVEMECYTNINEVIRLARERGLQVRDDRYRYNHDDSHTHWKLVPDGSVRGHGSHPGFDTIEIVSPILAGAAGLRQLQIMCKVLVEVGTVVNRSCGLHVHHDAHDMTVVSARRLARNYFNAQQAFDKLVAASRRGRQQYNNPHSTYELSNMDTTAEIRNFPSGRYYNVNIGPAYRTHQTFEFRQHHGTVEFQKVAAWVKLTGLMMEAAKAGTVIETGTHNLGVLFSRLGTPAHINQFFRERARVLKSITPAEYNAMLTADGQPVVPETPVDPDIPAIIGEDIPSVFTRDALGRIVPTSVGRA